MGNINSFIIIGNVTKDVELRYTGSGTSTATYTVAVDNVWYDGHGNKQEECDYIPVTTYGKQAENDAKYLKRGSMVAVTGRIRSWYKQEERRGGFNFEAEKVQYLTRAGSGAARVAPPSSDNLEHDDWTREYDTGAQSAPQKPRRA